MISNMSGETEGEGAGLKGLMWTHNAGLRHDIPRILEVEWSQSKCSILNIISERFESNTIDRL